MFSPVNFNFKQPTDYNFYQMAKDAIQNNATVVTECVNTFKSLVDNYCICEDLERIMNYFDIMSVDDFVKMVKDGSIHEYQNPSMVLKGQFDLSNCFLFTHPVSVMNKLFGCDDNYSAPLHAEHFYHNHELDFKPENDDN